MPWWLWAGTEGPGVATAAVGTVALAALAVAVDGLGSRRLAQLTVADQAERIEEERGRRAVLEERARIARELHDVVAHHMSLIAVRAETALYRLSGLPGPVCEEFGSLSGAAREALADMRRLLGMLRSDEPAAHAPQPMLADVPALIGEARQAGMAVELTTQARVDQVSPAASVCAYRIIQEALSNVGRHAAGAPVAVSVQQYRHAMVLQVASGPGGPGWQWSPVRPWPDRHAGAGRSARRVAVSRPGTRRQLRRARGAPAQQADGAAVTSTAVDDTAIRYPITDDQAMVREGSPPCSPRSQGWWWPGKPSTAPTPFARLGG